MFFTNNNFADHVITIKLSDFYINLLKLKSDAMVCEFKYLAYLNISYDVLNLKMINKENICFLDYVIRFSMIFFKRQKKCYVY